MPGGREILPPCFACLNCTASSKASAVNGLKVDIMVSAEAKAAGEPTPFLSECPKCQHDRVQTAYTRGELVLLLRDGADIEAHCSSCDEYWPISTEERADLASTLARAP